MNIWLSLVVFYSPVTQDTGPTVKVSWTASHSAMSGRSSNMFVVGGGGAGGRG